MKRLNRFLILLTLTCLVSLVSTALKTSAQESPVQPSMDKSAAKKNFAPSQSLNDALYLASRGDKQTSAYLDQAKSFLDNGATASVADARGRTPLHWAVLGGIYADSTTLIAKYSEITELIIGSGADVNAEDVFGNSPLDYQALSPNQPLKELLLQAGAQPGGLNELGQLQKLFVDASAAAKANDISAVRALVSADLPIGTLIQLKLTSSVSSTNRAGDPFQAVVSVPVVVDNRVVVAPHAKIEGTILYASKAANQYERSQLVLDFANFVWPDGTRTKLAVRLKSINNARETVDMDHIVGISYPNSALNSRKVTWTERLVGTLAPEVRYALEAATFAYRKELGREINYEPGTDMTVEVKVPSKLKVVPGLKGWSTFTPSTELVKLVNSQPYRVNAKDGSPLDITNVMLLGSEAQVQAAFAAAGWSDAVGLNVKSGLETFAAVLRQKGYDRAPFSDLYLSGRKPDLTFQRQLDTFAKRHHIRIWKVGTYQGKDVWLGAAAHDIGMGIDAKGVKPQWFHTVDSQVDRERDAVMNQLMFAGKVKDYSLVERPDMPKKNTTPAGHSRDTDSRMLVLDLDS